MSLTKEVIQHLEQPVLLADVNKALQEINPKAPVLATPHGIDLEDLERYMEHRSSYRFHFRTKSIVNFSDYCHEFDKQGAKCFVDSDDMSAQTIFDLGTEELPLHQQHRATLELDKTAAFRALLSINGTHLNQKQAADFLEDWSDNITVLTSQGETLTVSQSAQRLRNITIEQVRNMDSKVDDFGESMSSFEKIEAKNKDSIPSLLEFTCDPYHGLTKRAFMVRLSILTSSEKPMVSLRIIKLEAQEEDMAEEFKEILSDKFSKAELKVFIGRS